MVELMDVFFLFQINLITSLLLSFVLLMAVILVKVELRYFIITPGVLFVMITGVYKMLMSSVGSWDLIMLLKLFQMPILGKEMVKIPLNY